jgi:hypothetical protein
MKKPNIAIILLATCLAATLAAPARAQDAEDEDQTNVDDVRAAINELKQKKVVDVLDLTADAEEDFLDVYNRWEEVRWRYRERRQSLMEELRTAMVDQSDARPLPEILDDVDAVDAESRGSEERLRGEFRFLLSPEQYARLLLFEHQFNRNLRRLVQERQLQAPPAHEVSPTNP